MLLHIFLFFFLFFLLFFICRKISVFIYLLIFLLTKSEKAALWTLIILLLPGTIIHEVSHLIMATILRVPTGKLSIMPTVEKGPSFVPLSGTTAGKEIKTGTLTIGKSDPFRYTLVGIAPMIIGLTLIYLIGKFILPQATTSFFLLFIVYCLLFIVSATMFSSKKDLDSIIIVAPIIFLLLLTFYFIGVRISLTAPLLQKVSFFVSELNYFLLIANIVDFVVLLFLALNLSFWQKILGKKII